MTSPTLERLSSRPRSSRRRRRRLHAAICLVVAAAGLASLGSDAAAESSRLPPFVYEFRVVSFSMTATLTYANTAATIEYRLVRPSDARTVADMNNPRGFRLTLAAPVVDVVAKATYTSPDPSCTGKTIEYRPAGNKIQQVYVTLEPRSGVARRVQAEVRKIPLAIPVPGQDAGADPGGSQPLPKCGRPEMGHWYDTMEATAPVHLVTKPRLKLVGKHSERFTDPGIESIEWSLEITLQRLKYRPVDCAKSKGC